MGNHVTRHDFDWTDQDQPHNKRRIEMLKKHPQIRKLFGVDPTLKWKVVILVFLQFLVIHHISNFSWPFVTCIAYTFGGVINNSLFCAIHEINHGMGFGAQYPMANSLLAIFANLPIGVLLAMPFKIYHHDHHTSLGEEFSDVDIPSELEAKVFCTSFGKFVWVVLHPFFYALRPVFVNLKTPTTIEYFNLFVQVSFDIIVVYFLGIKPLFYLIGGSLMVSGFHPLAGHFISEHYVFKKGFETYSYYGPLNAITFNAGYHNEHHDFPYIPGCRLPELRKLAPEFYENLPSHDSWVRVIYEYIFNPDLGPYARVKRKRPYSRVPT